MSLAPPVNLDYGAYNAETTYDLPEGYRARVLCATNSVIVPPPKINVSKSTTLVQSYPNGTSVSVVNNVNASAETVVTTATYSSYVIKEFRIINSPPMEWVHIRDISVY
jgi:hypothetical protein